MYTVHHMAQHVYSTCGMVYSMRIVHGMAWYGIVCV